MQLTKDSIRFYETVDGNLVGWAQVETDQGPRAIALAVPLAPIAAQVRPMALAAVARQYQVAGDGVAGDEVGFFKWIARAWNSIKRAVGKVIRSIARSKLVRGIVRVVKAIGRGIVKAVKAVGNFVKKVINSPFVAGLVGVIAAVVPGVGPLIAAGYAATRAAMKVADAVAKGVDTAVKTVAAMTTQGGQKAVALIQSVAPKNLPIPDAVNPWLQGWAPPL